MAPQKRKNPLSRELRIFYKKFREANEDFGSEIPLLKKIIFEYSMHEP